MQENTSTKDSETTSESEQSTVFMGLNLGLEGLVVPEAEVKFSNEELLRSTLSASVAQNHMDKAFRDLHELLRNAANYTEILNSLQKHSSNECLAYASELLNQSK